MPPPIIVQRRVMRPQSAVVIPAPTLHFPMNEASGNALETIASLDMTAVSAPGTDTGVVGTSRLLVSATPRYFSRADNAAFQLGSVHTIGLWFYIVADSGSDQYLLGRDTLATAGSTNQDYLLRYEKATQKILFSYRYGSSLWHNNIEVASGIALTTWYCLGVKLDGTAVYGSLNGSSWVSGLSTTDAPVSGVNTPTIGIVRSLSGTAQRGWNGRIDIVTHWKGTGLTSAEFAAFYNAGAGHEYSAGVWV